MNMNQARRGFTFIEIMIVVAIVGMLAAIAIPNFLRYRVASRRSVCIANLKQMQDAKVQWACEYRKAFTDVPIEADLIGPTNYLRDKPYCPSGGSAIDWMRSVTNRAFKEGWAVLAADGPKVGVNDDTVQFGWAVLSSALDQFTRTWPQAKQWPVACAGFSGGAKRSAAVAAAMTRDGWRVVGVFLGGCNEDRATLGLQLFQPGPQFKQVPFFLSNGASDPIANPQHASTVAESMRANGFVNLRLESYPGGHRQHNDHLTEALQWFGRLANARSLPR